MALREAPHHTATLVRRESGVVVPVFPSERLITSPTGRSETALMLNLLGLDTRSVTTVNLRDLTAPTLAQFVRSTRYNSLEHCLGMQRFFGGAATKLAGSVRDERTGGIEDFKDFQERGEQISDETRQQLTPLRQALRVVSQRSHTAFEKLDLLDFRREVTRVIAEQVPENPGPQLAHEVAMYAEVNLRQIHSIHEVLSYAEGDSPRVRALHSLRAMYSDGEIPYGYSTSDNPNDKNFNVLKIT